MSLNQTNQPRKVPQNPCPQWTWTLSGSFGTYSGVVDAVDPRDAVARALTSMMADGRLYGEALKVPLDFLDNAPANNDQTFEMELDGIKLSVQKMVPGIDRKLSEIEYRQEINRLESVISTAKQRLIESCSLADKIERKIAVRDAEESLRQHKLNYFELVDTSLRQNEVMQGAITPVVDKPSNLTGQRITGPQMPATTPRVIARIRADENNQAQQEHPAASQHTLLSLSNQVAVLRAALSEIQQSLDGLADAEISPETVDGDFVNYVARAKYVAEVALGLRAPFPQPEPKRRLASFSAM